VTVTSEQFVNSYQTWLVIVNDVCSRHCRWNALCLFWTISAL